MSVKQYPHFLFVHVVADAVQDGEGNWSDPVDSWQLHSICREETNGAGRTINGPDGKAIVFSSTIYMPRTAKIAEGTEVRVNDTNDSEGVCRISRQVLKHDVSQLHGRLWL